MNQVYKFTKRIELYHVDGANILFYGQLFYILHDVLAQFLRDHNQSIKDRLDNKDYVFPIVHTKADYFSPIFLDDLVLVDLFVEKIGESSFTLRYKLKVNEKDVADATVIHAMIDPQTLTKRKIPETFRDVLENFCRKSV